jgi:hypothetical protein
VFLNENTAPSMVAERLYFTLFKTIYADLPRIVTMEGICLQIVKFVGIDVSYIFFFNFF